MQQALREIDQVAYVRYASVYPTPINYSVSNTFGARNILAPRCPWTPYGAVS